MKEHQNLKRPVFKKLFPLILLLVAVSLYRCGTSNNTPITRSYHNLTSYYNILFNGKESFKKGMEQYRENYTYDFTRLLPVFINGHASRAQRIKPQMERTIEKCSKLIRLHSISAKPNKLEDKRKLTREEKTFYNKNEFNKYVDDSYLLMGKAYFWEMKYQTASKVLEYAAREFKDQQITTTATIWLARCHIEMGQLREAEKLLNDLQEEEAPGKKQKGLFYATRAQLSIARENYRQATDHLSHSVIHNKDKTIKERHAFIIAQLHEEMDQPEKAFKQYGKLIGMNPDYGFEFNAKLKRAWLHHLTDRGGGGMKRELQKMLDDEKNEDYRDQIYYALGKIAIQNDQAGKAVEYFKKSIRYSTNNQNQKGISYLSLADIYFSGKKYETAQAYYDSAVTSLESSYPGYTDLYVKTRHLTDLVENLNTIERQDSLQRVAQMPEPERNTLITRLIQQHQKKQREESGSRQSRRPYSQRTPAVRSNSGNRESGSWYFYSQTAMRQGLNEFQRRWGDRELEDNWRLSNKKTADFGDFSTRQEETQEPANPYSRTNRQYYLQDLPMSDSAMKASRQKIREAIYNVATIYMNDLNNPAKAIEAFEELNSRFPSNPYKPGTYYYLYKLNRETGNAAAAQRYKDRIIARYPQSNYAKVLENPDYFRELEKTKNRIEKMYSRTLQLYEQGRYSQTIDSCNKALSLFKQRSHLARFEYLKALSVGQTSDIISFRNSLQKVVDNYPGTQVAGEANGTLTYLQKTELQQIGRKFRRNKTKNNGSNNQNTPETPQPKQSDGDSLYSFERETPHYFVVVTNTQQTDLGRLKFDLINFNLDFFLQKDYNTTSQPFNEFFSAVTVKRFDNYQEAKKYYELISKKEGRVFTQQGMEDYRYFFISVKNYVTLLDKKSIIEYINFFNEKIL